MVDTERWFWQKHHIEKYEEPRDDFPLAQDKRETNSYDRRRGSRCRVACSPDGGIMV